MDQPKLERLLRLMKLLTANTTYDIDQLAERLQMSRRTVYRYIDTFREAGSVSYFVQCPCFHGIYGTGSFELSRIDGFFGSGIRG